VKPLQRSVFWFCLTALALLVVASWCWTAAAEQAKKPPPTKPLDLNKATVEQLQKLSGIGPSTAKAIVRFREKSGPFRRVEDLLAIRGITKRKLEQLRPYLTVENAQPKPPSKQGQGKKGGMLTQ
jgi:competence ComEA-like helix-hairpin-helix protein